jgi:hypothetical protein
MQYEREPCPICGNSMSKGGAARTSHMRAHVRKGEAKEEKVDGKLTFLPAEGIPGVYVEPEPFAKLGQTPLPHQPKNVWDATEAIEDLPAIDPKMYYITSGEGVRKADKLVRDLYSLAVRAQSLKKKMLKARAEAKFLETCRDDGRLLVKQKNQKNRGPKK